MKYTIVIFAICTSTIAQAFTPNDTLSLEEILNNLVLQSPTAQIEQINYQNEILNFENYRKGLLPSVSFSFNPINFNRSLRLLQKPDDGSYSSVEDYSNTSNTSLTVTQKVGLSGGEISVGTNLSYLNEFSQHRNSFSSSPFFINYSQQLRGGRRTFRFEKEMQYVRNQLSIKKYCSSISQIQQEALNLFLTALVEQLKSELALRNQQMNDSLLHIAQVKLANGHITKYDYRQVEVQTLEIEYAYQNALKLSETAKLQLKTFLNLDSERFMIDMPEFDMPLAIDCNDVVYYMKQNNPFLMEQQVKKIEAERQLFSARLETYFNGTVSINYGINQYAETFVNAYRHPNTQQSVVVGFQIPIFQWGINRNKRKIAKNTYQAGLLDMENSIRKFHNEIKEGVNNYNHAVNLWKLSDRSYQLQQDQYRMAIKSFELGNISVYELISALKRQDEALHQYHSAIKEAYTSYFTLRHIALYDFKQGKSLEDILISTQ